MEYLIRVDLDFFALVICSLILVDILKHKDEHHKNKLFTYLVISNILLLSLEILFWAIDGKPGPSATSLNMIINILSFILNPFPAGLWVLYTHSQVVKDEELLEKLLIPIFSLIIIFGILTLTSPITNYLFYFDGNNVYHRGPLFLVLPAINTLFFTYSFITVYYHQRRISRNHFVALMLFPLPLIIGAILQGLFYGLTLMWSGMTLSLIFVYNNYQAEKLTTDFLTGVNNRMGLKQYLNNTAANEKTPLGGIIIDIDNFKQINDRFGHTTGDRALVYTAELLRYCSRKEDLIARYGGDEFIILVNTKFYSTLELISNRIRASIKKFNATSNEPFTLDVSIGYDLFDSRFKDEDTFIKHIDSLMYNDKQAKVPVQQPVLPIDTNP